MKEVAVGILTRDGLVLACQRRRTVRYPLKWEFPGGKLERGETPPDTLRRELREELSIDAGPMDLLHRQEWTYPEASGQDGADRTYRVFYYTVRSFHGEPVNHVFEQIRWVSLAELEGMDILEGNREAVRLLITCTDQSDGRASEGA